MRLENIFGGQTATSCAKELGLLARALKKENPTRTPFICISQKAQLVRKSGLYQVFLPLLFFYAALGEEEEEASRESSWSPF